MPSINIHAHCEDNESFLALLEAVQLNATEWHFMGDSDPTSKSDAGFDDADAYLDAAQRIADTEARLGALVSEECTADPCTDPFCDTHGVHEWSGLRDEPSDERPTPQQVLFSAMLDYARQFGTERENFMAISGELLRDAWGTVQS